MNPENTKLAEVEKPQKKNSIFRKIAVKFFVFLYLIVLGGIGTQLFLGDILGDRLALLSNFFARPVVHSSAESLTIAYASPVNSLDPVNFDPVTQSRLLDVYEGLVRTNKNLKIESALAVSWGMLDENTWEFRLRPNVKFHNGKILNSADVVSSLERAKDFPQSQLKNFFSNVTAIKAVDDSRIQIVTSQPDPLLLNKLAVAFIYPKDFTDFAHPIGTGPYSFVSADSVTMTNERFNDYWGDKPYFQSVILKAIPDKDARQQALEQGKVQILADVPPATVKDLAAKGFATVSIPSLEVNFLMFNVDDPLWKNVEVRKSIPQSLEAKVFVDFANGFAHPIGQFVSSGIFGFNPDIAAPAYNLAQAQKDFQTTASASLSSEAALTVTFDYPAELDVLGQYIQTQFAALGIDLKLNPLSDQDLQKKIVEGTSQLYFLGWRSELGDSDDFLSSIVHSPDKQGLYGQFNGSHYSNADTDKAIEQSRQELDPKKRLNDLQNLMKKIVDEDVIGVPLFESEKVFAYAKNIHFEPRVDGYISAASVQ